MEEEVSFVCTKICELINDGVDINKISLCNVSSDYYYTLKRLFSYYKIPINIPFKNSIYSTKVVKDYLDTGVLDLEDLSKYNINKKLVNYTNLDDSIRREIVISNLKNTYLPNTKYNNAVNIKDLYKEEFLDDEYIFVLGFNQDVLPKSYKDIEYISDIDKKELDMYYTEYLKKILLYIYYLILRIYI